MVRSHGAVAELADARDLKSRSVRSVGSSPTSPITKSLVYKLGFFVLHVLLYLNFWPSCTFYVHKAQYLHYS